MRRIRSESCTFIWQPKVLMHAVLPPEVRPSPEGFLRRGIGAVGASVVVLFILFLRLVDAGFDGDLSGTALEPEILHLQIPGPRRPP
jgi:hypothetical protein